MQPIKRGARGAFWAERRRICGRLRRRAMTHVVNAPHGRPCHDRVAGTGTAPARNGRCGRLRFGAADYGVAT